MMSLRINDNELLVTTNKLHIKHLSNYDDNDDINNNDRYDILT